MKRIFRISRFLTAISILALITLRCSIWGDINKIIFPIDFEGQAGIIFDLEGYPPLPILESGKRIIQIPSNGILITSTKIEEIPTSIEFFIGSDRILDFNKINLDTNFKYDCIISNNSIRVWLFTLNKIENTIVRDKVTELCNDINENKLMSTYKSDSKSIWKDDKGKYLWLQNKNLTSLPDKISELEVYQAILTNNDFTEIPKPILEINTLTHLIFAMNPISEFPNDLHKLINLKNVSFAATKIKKIEADLTKLEKLEYFGFSRNNLTTLPDEVKNIPNLKRLALDLNQFTDLSFVDKRLDKLEMLYLQSNNIKEIGEETKYLSNLKELLIFENKIEAIPDNIENLINLEILEIWNNPIKSISPKISELNNLKSMGIDDDYLSKKDKENLKIWLPNCKINYRTRSEKLN